ncbi:lipase family alpha/beta hydrolase [Nocardia seriolae]|uniref:lipase family alpha/beta hydrolase n=1 Tax=Nocardia seriolae TaxID=37332 RepID=UPI003608382E
MALPGFPNPTGVAEYDDRRRRERMCATLLGAGWVRWRSRRRRLTLLRLSLIPLVTLGAFAEYLAVDVLPAQGRLARTEPAVLPIAGPSDPRASDTAVFDLVGLGVLDASDTARSLPALTELGSVWAVRYDQTGIDTKVIANLIVKVTAAAKAPNVVLTGHSMGGVIALEVARHLHASSTEKVRAVILDCTPVDLNAVRPESRDQGEEMLRWMGWVPGARESRLLRLIVEMYAHHEHFVGGRYGLRGAEFRTAVKDILRDKILNGDAASNGLIEAQFKAIVAGGAVDDLRVLAKPVAGKPRPAIVFIRPHDPYDDPIVDVDYSHRVLIDRVGGVDGTLLVVTTRTTGHANPIERPREYNGVIENQVVPFVRQIRQDEAAVESLGR